MSDVKIWSLNRMARLSGMSLDDRVDFYIMPLSVSAVRVVNGRVSSLVVDGVDVGIHVKPTVGEFENAMNKALDTAADDVKEYVKSLEKERASEPRARVVGDRVDNKKEDLN